MAERPLILFKKFEEAQRADSSGGAPKFAKPSVEKQMSRLSPKFQELQHAIDRKTIAIQNSPSGINPDSALVLETVGSVDSFYTVIKNIDDLELMLDITLDGIEKDEDFYLIDKKGNLKDGDLPGKLYCVMTNKKALDQLISLWRQYVQNPKIEFQLGFNGVKNMFNQLKEIRYWSPQDRIDETRVVEYWQESLQFNGDENVNFEIELFFRRTPEQRNNSSSVVTNAIKSMGGLVLSECVIPNIMYHAILVTLPRNQIELLVNSYEQVALTRVDDIMFFRPVGQIAFPLHRSETDQETTSKTPHQGLEIHPISENPVVAILDGFPMQNHSLLANRLIVDDPDNWANEYVVRDRVHGTAMASLVVHGDLNGHSSPIDSKVYIRPILKPTRDFNDNLTECAPDDVLLIDLIHTAVRRIVVGDENSRAITSVKIINLSFGDPSRVFINMMSPLARLLDWLSYTYKILFIISAGNHNQQGIDIGIPFDEFKKLTPEERETMILQNLNSNSRNIRLLSPAESINNLSIGALFNDFSNVTENERFIFPYKQPLPSPVSAIGLGYNRSIKPDIFYNGGRKFVRESLGSTVISWIPLPTKPPGSCVATPGQSNEINEVAYSFGTSDAAAQVSHEGAKCHSVLREIFLTQTGDDVPNNYTALLIKAMLVHGATWNHNYAIANAVGIAENRIFRWLGNGVPDINRVMECAKHRMTLIGYGALQKGKAHVYQLPVPFEFTTRRFFRKLTVTLAYFSPTTPSKQKYRSAHLWFNIENNKLTPNRLNTDYKAVQRGTTQHEIFYGDQATAWNPNDFVNIRVNCREDAENTIPDIEYAVLVTFEMAEEICEQLDIDVYESITTKIRELVPITPSSPN